MTRIKCTNIQYGESFVLPIEKSEEEKPESPEVIKLKEELASLSNEIEQAKLQKQELIEQGQKQAEELVTKANADIAQMKEEAEKQLEAEAMKVKEEAYKTGYDDGYKQGYDTITTELENKVEAVEIFAGSQFDLKNNIIKSSELDIVNLVIEIAKKVCTKAVEMNPDLIEKITLKAIKLLKDKEEIKIIVNPQLVEVINTVSEKLKEEIPQLKTIRIIEDSNISPDGTIVESLLTRVDSRVKAQINVIADKMMSNYHSEEFGGFDIEAPSIIEDLEEIKLSDDANIEEFLEELEDVHSFEDKASDEEVEYYENIDLEELKNDIPAKTAENSIENINLDTLDDYGAEISQQDLDDAGINLDEVELTSEEKLALAENAEKSEENDVQ